MAIKDERFNLISMWATPRNEDLAREREFVADALRENKREGIVLAFRARVVACVAAGLMIATSVPFPGWLYLWAFLALFVLIGALQVRLARFEPSRWEIGLLMLDVVLLVFMMLAPNPLLAEDWPASTAYQFDAYKYVFVFLAATTVGYSWRTVFSFGTWVALVWLSAALLMWAVMGDHSELRGRLLDAVGGNVNFLEAIDPTLVAWRFRIEEAVVVLLVTIILGVNAFRSNRLLLRQAQAAHERANLARHFPAWRVDDLAGRDVDLSGVRTLDAVVVFVDIVGFTPFSERAGPERSIAALRDFHAQVEEIVFRHGGTLDKFTGDGVMATFGTPEPAADDAARAVAAIREIAAITLPGSLRVAVGAHRGPVVLGDIGSARRTEYATIGDTVNVAARLEEATREHGVAALVSEAVCEEAGECEGFGEARELRLRGRAEPLLARALIVRSGAEREKSHAAAT